jgi:putative zinc finger/helix-turn-helix YgiT family protein
VGHYEEIVTEYRATLADGVELEIPGVKLLRCQNCGDELIPAETQDQIDRAIAEKTEQLSQQELEEISVKFDLDQTQISEVLGLGSKTFHRWLNGTQYPSRSMCYYLRVLAEFPEAMEWLKERGWRRHNRVSQIEKINLATQFSDLAWVTRQLPSAVRGWQQQNFSETENRRFNPVSAFVRTKVT